MAEYDYKAIEAKWQKAWEEQGLYHQDIDPTRPKYYALTMLPYPSGDLHIGHWYAMAPSDANARYHRMRGYNVLFPMGFDAFGLPAENAAIKRGIHPRTWTMQNIENMRRQLRSMGAMFDWRREVVTCVPEYYKWNQWFFLQMYKRGLAYKKMAPVDFCPKCNTTLAREQVVGPERLCERCDTPVVKKDLDQWFFRITAYADELLDFSKIDWPERVKTMQANWIGKSKGVEFDFQVRGTPHTFRVFTTRVDTIFGVSFAVLAPEHPLVDEITTPDHAEEVHAYQYKASRQSEIDRLSTERERDGVFTGAYAVHPLTGEDIPIYVADYVLMSYGTGAIMGVPGHDERDYDFARRVGLPIPVVVAPLGWDGVSEFPLPYVEPGLSVNSGEFSNLPTEEAKVRIGNAVIARANGRWTVHYRLRDWLISRQRYWGTPIPIVYCERCGIVPVPEEDLPVILPDDAEFLPTGESPLKFHEGFRHTTCPQCGGPAERETDTMDTFVDSSWYHYRYLSPHRDDVPFDPAEGAYWLPVDQYTGGVEHAVMHLLYTRFFTKVMRDLGLVNFDEPMLRLYNQGIILAEDGARMSKSRGNVVSPDDLVERYGADAVRTYLMFMAPWDQGGPWSSRGIGGAVRFLDRVWRLVAEPIAGRDGEMGDAPMDAGALHRLTHRTINRVTEDFDRFHFNTAIAALMEFTNNLYRMVGTPLYGAGAWNEAVEALLLMLAPIAPHITEELWYRRGHTTSIHLAAWPTADPAALAEDLVTIVLQINGKVRDRFSAPADATAEELERLALALPKVQALLEGRKPKKIVAVPGHIVNVVVG